MHLLEIININQILFDYFKSKNGGNEVSVINTFLNGYCLEYYEILKCLHPDAVLVSEKRNNHCAALIDGVVYDVSGYREPTDFFIADEAQEDFIYSFYGHFSPDESATIKALIKREIKDQGKKLSL